MAAAFPQRLNAPVRMAAAALARRARARARGGGGGLAALQPLVEATSSPVLEGFVAALEAMTYPPQRCVDR
jgi:hypothetical protein